uniref:hypothetical protein n=1 Tax=Enterocloster clostridioformis TaxID=1531 RepID=UPI0025A53F00|nr:hypothetical protein [Enterocloster clostridioformis]
MFKRESLVTLRNLDKEMYDKPYNAVMEIHGDIKAMSNPAASAEVVQSQPYPTWMTLTGLLLYSRTPVSPIRSTQANSYQVSPFLVLSTVPSVWTSPVSFSEV